MIRIFAVVMNMESLLARKQLARPALVQDYVHERIKYKSGIQPCEKYELVSEVYGQHYQHHVTCDQCKPVDDGNFNLPGMMVMLNMFFISWNLVFRSLSMHTKPVIIIFYKSPE